MIRAIKANCHLAKSGERRMAMIQHPRISVACSTFTSDKSLAKSYSAKCFVNCKHAKEKGRTNASYLLSIPEALLSLHSHTCLHDKVERWVAISAMCMFAGRNRLNNVPNPHA